MLARTLRKLLRPSALVMTSNPELNRFLTSPTSSRSDMTSVVTSRQSSSLPSSHSRSRRRSPRYDLAKWRERKEAKSAQKRSSRDRRVTSELGLSRAVEVVTLEDDPEEKEVEIPVVEEDDNDLAWKMLETGEETKRKKPNPSKIRSRLKEGLNFLMGKSLGSRSTEDIPLPPDPKPVFTRAAEIDRRFRRRWFDTKLGSEIASGTRRLRSREVEVKLMNYNVLADNLMKMHPELYRGIEEIGFRNDDATSP